jgi:hypothetical protein
LGRDRIPAQRSEKAHPEVSGLSPGRAYPIGPAVSLAPDHAMAVWVAVSAARVTALDVGPVPDGDGRLAGGEGGVGLTSIVLKYGRRSSLDRCLPARDQVSSTHPPITTRQSEPVPPGDQGLSGCGHVFYWTPRGVAPAFREGLAFYLCRGP